MAWNAGRVRTGAAILAAIMCRMAPSLSLLSAPLCALTLSTLQVRAKFLDFTGHELACVAWSLRRFGYSTRDNAVFYMLQKQQGFLAADFEILSNPKLLRQVLGWKAAADGEESADAEGGGGGRGGRSR